MHSNGISVERLALLRFYLENALKQHVNIPTREKKVLDLVISNIIHSRALVQRRISDHNMMLACFIIRIPEKLLLRLVVYEYSKASWGELQTELENMRCSHMDVFDVDAT